MEIRVFDFRLLYIEETYENLCELCEKFGEKIQGLELYAKDERIVIFGKDFAICPLCGKVFVSGQDDTDTEPLYTLNLHIENGSCEEK